MSEATTTAEHRVLPLLEHLARVGRRASEATMSGGGLRPRHLVALRLLGEGGPITQHALGDALCLDPSNVVGLLNELERRELTIRRRDPSDRRRHIVEIAPAGRAALSSACQELGGVEDRVLGALTMEERATLYDLLVRAVGAGSTAPPCGVADDGPCAAGSTDRN